MLLYIYIIRTLFLIYCVPNCCVNPDVRFDVEELFNAIPAGAASGGGVLFNVDSVFFALAVSKSLVSSYTDFSQFMFIIKL